MNRVCKKCGIEKDINDFYLSGKKDFRKYTCKLCEIDRVKKWQSDHPKQYNDTREQYIKSGRYSVIAKRHRITEKYKKKDAIRTRRYMANKPDESRIRVKTRQQINNGNIKRTICCICGGSPTHAHHEDYSNPLDVIFLCPKHHVRRHKNMNEPFYTFAIRSHK